jgi:predicted phage terminase large subunit-like protein
VLQPDRDRIETFDEIKRQIGSRHFAAQYQQDPAPTEGNLIKAGWLVYSSPSPLAFERIVLSCDPAGKSGVANDYTALVIAGVIGSTVHILDVARDHWSIMEMIQQIITRARRWNVALVMIEDTSTGMGLIQLLRQQTRLSVIGRQPKGDKVQRVLRQQAKFEAGQVLLPIEEAPWLADFEKELLSFPNSKHDDQVDALVQILEWNSPTRMRNEVDLGQPVQAKDGVSNPFAGEADAYNSTPWLF